MPPRAKPKSSRKTRGTPQNLSSVEWIYGRHAAAAAIGNPRRRILRVLATENAAAWTSETGVTAPLQPATAEEIETRLPNGAVHQGIAVEAAPLQAAALDDAVLPAATGRPVVILDQITDPQNIGAIFRSAAAFGACAIIVQDRRTPPLNGALAKAAAGAVEIIPCVPVVNIARAIDRLKAEGYFVLGLAGEAEADVADAPRDAPLALCLGAEGAGLRRLTREACDLLIRIPMAASVESLNVSNAAAVSLYALTRR